MKRVLLHGYTMNNLGDDLFFRVLIQRYPNVQFYLPTLNISYKNKFKDLTNLKVIDFLGVSRITNHQIYKLPKLYSKINIKKFDAVVCIGGSLFIDRKNPSVNDRIEAENYSFIADWKYAEQNNIPYYVIGANWGPCYNEYFFNYFDKAFDSLNDLCFRDTYSFEVFKYKSNVRCTGDILMANPLIINSVDKKEKKKQISISVVDATRKSESIYDYEIYENKIAELSNEFSLRGYEVILLSFCEGEGDVVAAKRILNMIPDKSNIKLLSYHNNWNEMLNTMYESEIMIATRFHATVLGWTLGTKVFSIAYSDKTIHFIEDCELSNSYLKIQDVDKLTLDFVLNNATFPKNIVQYNGLEAFERLDDLLKEK